MDALLPSKPLSYRHLIKYSFALYRASFKRILLLTFLMSLVVFIPRLLSDVIGQDIFANLSPVSPHRLWLFAVELVALAFFIAILWRMHCVIHGLNEPLIEDMTVGLKKLLYVFVAAVIQGIVIFSITLMMYVMLTVINQYREWIFSHTAGVFLFFLISMAQVFLILYIEVLFIFYVPLITIEKKGVLDAIQRSIYLGWNHWWRIFSTQLTPWVVFLTVLITLKYGFGIEIHFLIFDQSASNPWITILQIILFALFIPWVAALLLTQLKDLELRKHISSNI